MAIIIDGDGCPVIRITERLAKEYNIPVLILCDTSHMIQSKYSQVKTIDKGADAVDFAIIKQGQKGDMVITQDYGVAAMALGKGMLALHQNGKEYTNANIDMLLMERHMAKQARKSSKSHCRGPRKRTNEDDERFEKELRRIIEAKCI